MCEVLTEKYQQFYHSGSVTSSTMCIMFGFPNMLSIHIVFVLSVSIGHDLCNAELSNVKLF